MLSIGHRKQKMSSLQHSQQFVQELSLQYCPRVLIDGGANNAESVKSFISGHFHNCALHGPLRLYPSAWKSRSQIERRALVGPLRQPSSWCVRAFEANPKLMPLLLKEEALLRSSSGTDVRFIAGSLSNVSAHSSPQKVVTYAKNEWGSTATTFKFEDIFSQGKPKRLATEMLLAPSYDMREVLRAALYANRSAIVALRLDIEGGELWRMAELAQEPELLCSLSYIFVEFHHLPGRRANLTKYGLPENQYDLLKDKVHAAMERPGCRLQIYWRSFWSACGDAMRFQWQDTFQASDRQPTPRGRTNGRRGGRRRRAQR